MEGGPHQMAKYQANIQNKCAPIDPTNKQLQAQWTGLGFQKRARKALGMGKERPTLEIVWLDVWD